MGIFRSMKKTVDAVYKAVKDAAMSTETKCETFTFAALPETIAELQDMPESSLTNPFAVAGLTMAVLSRYEENKDETIEMLNFLKGPEPLSSREVQDLHDRLHEKMYIVRSFFAGATPENNYQPSVPYMITISETPNSYLDGENYLTLYMKSSGTVSLRQIKLRKKPSSGQWFVTELQILSDTGTPAAEDPWA